jgi:hypothetical protein
LAADWGYCTYGLPVLRGQRLGGRASSIASDSVRHSPRHEVCPHHPHRHLMRRREFSLCRAAALAQMARAPGHFLRWRTRRRRIMCKRLDVTWLMHSLSLRPTRAQGAAAPGTESPSSGSTGSGSSSTAAPGTSSSGTVSSGTGSSSSSACASTLAAPTGLVASAASSSAITLKRSAATAPANCSIGSYNVYGSTTKGFTPSSSNLLASGLTGTSYSNMGLSGSSTHY